MTTPTNANDHVREGSSTVPPLDQDYETPFALAAENAVESDSESLDDEETMGDSHPLTDAATDIDSQQLYDEGFKATVGLDDPSANSAVLGYDPAKDQRRK